MFRKSKEKETNKVIATTASTGSTYQSSSVRTTSDSLVHQRTVTQVTSTKFSSVSSIREIESSLVKTSINGSPSYITSPLLSKSLNNSSGKLSASWQIDAKPFDVNNTKLVKSSSSGSVGYQSPFSRKLSPYRLSATDARPFNSQTETSSPISVARTLSPSSTFVRNEPSYSSYRPAVTPTRTPLLPSSSTQSLPAATESSQRADPRIPTYDTNGKKRGKVLIINNIKFLEEQNERKGAKTDEENLSRLFKSMGFDVSTHRNLNMSGMMNKLTQFKNDSSLKKVDMSIVVMMSHGNNIDNTGRIVHGGFTQIYGVDNEGLQIDTVLDLFSAESCRALAGKPKIFIFQCCRGDKYETLHNDAAPMRDIKRKHADMLIAFSTLPGFYSIRDTVQGSWYIQSIYEVFKRHAKEFDVETLLKIVDQELSKKHPTYKQTSTYESRGFKCCYLNPK